MRAVKARLATPLGEVVSGCQKKSNEEMVAGTALFSLPTPGLEISASGSETVPENVFSAPSELPDCKVQGQATTPLRPPFRTVRYLIIFFVTLENLQQADDSAFHGMSGCCNPLGSHSRPFRNDMYYRSHKPCALPLTSCRIPL